MECGSRNAGAKANRAFCFPRIPRILKSDVASVQVMSRHNNDTLEGTFDSSADFALLRVASGSVLSAIIQNSIDYYIAIDCLWIICNSYYRPLPGLFQFINLRFFFV